MLYVYSFHHSEFPHWECTFFFIWLYPTTFLTTEINWDWHVFSQEVVYRQLNNSGLSAWYLPSPWILSSRAVLSRKPSLTAECHTLITHYCIPCQPGSSRQHVLESRSSMISFRKNEWKYLFLWKACNFLWRTWNRDERNWDRIQSTTQEQCHGGCLLDPLEPQSSWAQGFLGWPNSELPWNFNVINPVKVLSTLPCYVYYLHLLIRLPYQQGKGKPL